MNNAGYITKKRKHKLIKFFLMWNLGVLCGLKNNGIAITINLQNFFRDIFLKTCFLNPLIFNVLLK